MGGRPITRAAGTAGDTLVDAQVVVRPEVASGVEDFLAIAQLSGGRDVDVRGVGTGTSLDVELCRDDRPRSLLRAPLATAGRRRAVDQSARERGDVAVHSDGRYERSVAIGRRR